MTIEYRTLDEEQTKNSIMERRALEARESAISNEREVKRLEALQIKAGNKAEKDAFQSQVTLAKKVAKEARARANRLGQGVDLEVQDTEQQRVALTGQLNFLESEHITQSIAIEQRVAALATTGTNAPGVEEKAGMRERLAQARKALEEVEASWQVIASELDALPEPPVLPVAPPDAPRPDYIPVDPPDAPPIVPAP